MSKGPSQIFDHVGNFVHSFKNIFGVPSSQTIPASFNDHYVRRHHLQEQQQNSSPHPNPITTTMNGLFPQLLQDVRGVCVKVCAFEGLAEHLAGMRDTLDGLRQSLMTLEYCLVILTMVLTMAIGLGVVVGLVLFCRLLWRDCCRRERTVLEGSRLAAGVVNKGNEYAEFMDEASSTMSLGRTNNNNNNNKAGLTKDQQVLYKNNNNPLLDRRRESYAAIGDKIPAITTLPPRPPPRLSAYSAS